MRGFQQNKEVNFDILEHRSASLLQIVFKKIYSVTDFSNFLFIIL